MACSLAPSLRHDRLFLFWCSLRLSNLICVLLSRVNIKKILIYLKTQLNEISWLSRGRTATFSLLSLLYNSHLSQNCYLPSITSEAEDACSANQRKRRRPRLGPLVHSHIFTNSHSVVTVTRSNTNDSLSPNKSDPHKSNAKSKLVTWRSESDRRHFRSFSAYSCVVVSSKKDPKPPVCLNHKSPSFGFHWMHLRCTLELAGSLIFFLLLSLKPNNVAAFSVYVLDDHHHHLSSSVHCFK